MKVEKEVIIAKTKKEFQAKLALDILSELSLSPCKLVFVEAIALLLG